MSIAINAATGAHIIKILIIADAIIFPTMIPASRYIATLLVVDRPAILFFFVGIRTILQIKIIILQYAVIQFTITKNTG